MSIKAKKESFVLKAFQICWCGKNEQKAIWKSSVCSIQSFWKVFKLGKSLIKVHKRKCETDLLQNTEYTKIQNMKVHEIKFKTDLLHNTVFTLHDALSNPYMSTSKLNKSKQTQCRWLNNWLFWCGLLSKWKYYLFLWIQLNWISLWLISIPTILACTIKTGIKNVHVVTEGSLGASAAAAAAVVGLKQKCGWSIPDKSSKAPKSW